MGPKNPLVVPHQQPPITDEQHQNNLQVIQRWVNSQPAPPPAGITDITSVDGSVDITNPTGPTVDLSVDASVRSPWIEGTHAPSALLPGVSNSVTAIGGVAGGEVNTVSANNGAAFGSTNVVSGVTAFAVGNNNTTSGADSFSAGSQNLVQSTGGVALGNGGLIVTAATSSVMMGTNARANNPNELAHAGGLTVPGRAGQYERMVLSVQWSSGPTNLVLSGGGALPLINTATTTYMRGVIVMRDDSGPGPASAWTWQGVLEGTTFIGGNPTPTLVAQDAAAAAWVVAVAPATVGGNRVLEISCNAVGYGNNVRCYGLLEYLDDET